MQRDQDMEAEFETDVTTPLIRNNNANYFRAASQGPRGKEPEWPGQADFDGQPWYKKPSVRLQQDHRDTIKLIVIRSSGYFRHSC